MVAACGARPATPSPSARPSPGVSPSAAASPAGLSVPWDDVLLGILPVEVDERPLVPEPAAFAESASDPDLVRDASAGVVAFVVGEAGDDYAVPFVYALRRGVFDEGWYRSWRDSFDEGVCAQAGGVAGTAEAVIAGRSTVIGSCVGGVLTYHTHLVVDGVDHVVSIQALGPGRYGELVIAGLRA